MPVIELKITSSEPVHEQCLLFGKSLERSRQSGFAQPANNRLDNTGSKVRIKSGSTVDKEAGPGQDQRAFRLG
jgi:hypothetical protein